MSSSVVNDINNEAAPKRFIFNESDLAKFLDSPSKHALLNQVTAMGKSCAGVRTMQYDPNDPLEGLSPAMACLHGALQEMHQTWLAAYPPDVTVQARFGNPSFRQWHARLVERSASIVHAILQVNVQYPVSDVAVYDKVEVLEEASARGVAAAQTTLDVNTLEDPQDRAAILELSAYLQDSFGHPVRLDYGTGHESSFQVFLYALSALGCFGSTSSTEPPPPERLKAITLSIYTAYLAVTRQIQTDYMLEPAGSHGVWGLDDYYCLSFYFGACQMQSLDEEIPPSAIHDQSLLEKDGDRLMYLGCIRYIKTLKKNVPFFECSPMLNDISNLTSWSKVSIGLLRLYEGEVLKKRPVVQHFVFGKLFPANWKPSHAPRPPPQGAQTFRSPVAGGAQLQATRAPWASGEEDGGNTTSGMPPPTKAPWAK
mmetsp:Transcript_12567/g.23907  ORF Transcript_12567/g.23907 Transcript_12567/m.23907 type:complete len:426 (+) Transcript_12567:83-1360(+)|eukprot:scaffold4298_cov183-Amphora_coffeaeformis.AAC.2